MDIKKGKHESEAGFAKALEQATRNEKDSPTDQSLEKKYPKNPMLISPIIRCVMEFLSIEDIKNCRLVCHEWGSTGKLSLASRAKIHIQINSPNRCPVDFGSCFLNSATLFSAFQISIYLYYISTQQHERGPTTIEELNSFFEDQQKSIKELTLKFQSIYLGQKLKSIDLSSWISKSPLVQKDAKHLTKLLIEGDKKNLLILPFHLICEIKDLTLSSCRINLDSGIKICSAKLKLKSVTFYQDGNKLNRVRINDIVDLCKAEEISLHCLTLNSTQCFVNLCGNSVLKKLILEECEIVNGETSQWVIEHLWLSSIRFSLNSEMKVKELYLYNWDTLDLANLPNSLQKLVLYATDNGVSTISCSQPIVLQNLQYLNISFGGYRNHLSHFVNCPRLTHLKFLGCILRELKSNMMPKNLKTLTIQDSVVHWADDVSLNLEKVVVCRHWYPTLKADQFLNTEIRVKDLVLYEMKMVVSKYLVDFLEYRNSLNIGKRLYIGKVDWKEKQLEESVLKDYVDVKSSFYVFENGEKGRAFSEKAFYELIPKHIDIEL